MNKQNDTIKRFDIMTLKAAEMFDIAPSAVTQEQRNLAKIRYHADNYRIQTKNLNALRKRNDGHN